MRERFIGAMLGLACGDALGAPAEFKTKTQARREFGVLRDMVGGGIWEPGEWTDDTGMALCVAEGILAAPQDPVSEIGTRFLEWQKTAKDVGNTIGAALDAFEGDWPEAARSTPQAKSGSAAGNGSLMRTLPVALAYSDSDTMLRQSARISAMTHWDAQAETCCAIYCRWVQKILGGEPLRESWRNALAETKTTAANYAPTPETPGISAENHPLWQRLEKAESLTQDDLQPTGYAGYAVECLEAAAWCVIYSDSLEQTLVRAVNLAGESDTIGAVAGGLAGAFYGVDSIPARWLEKLYRRHEIEEIASPLVNLRLELETAA